MIERWRAGYDVVYGVRTQRKENIGKRALYSVFYRLFRWMAYIDAAGREEAPPRLLGIWAPWRLRAYGYTLAAIYAALFVLVYRSGTWLVDRSGAPIPNDYTVFLIEARHALAGNLVSGYPPIFYLMLVPFTLMPYLIAFIAFQATTLLGFAGVVYLIVRRRPAIALALASPFAAWNFIAGQSGALTAALLGAALLTFDRRPVLAGVFIGWLTYKPHCGILIPLALLAGGRWRAIAGAAVTTVILAGLSIAFFGIAPCSNSHMHFRLRLI